MFLKRNPIIRLLLPLIGGILIQWHVQPTLSISIIALLTGVTLFIVFSNLPTFYKLKYRFAQTIIITLAIVAAGMMLTWLKDTRHQPAWFGNRYQPETAVIATLQEPLVTKERSYKAEADISFLINNGRKKTTKGKVLLYFRKDSINQQLKAGDRILFKRTLNEIKNSGNPGGFDYKKYCLFNGITHQAFLTNNDYELVGSNYISKALTTLQATRSYVLTAIKKNITGKKEQGLAEAMLIGYRDDLDKTLLQSYTNTGVVHVIAVSGMHLALLYWIINLLLKPLLKRKATRWLHPILVLATLWSFAFITGGAASIVRAAVMFTFITIGKQLNRNSSIYNTLAASAFCQLCYNPYWLWDVGFQLSYVAVLSIVIFYKPVYHLLFIKNKILNWLWQLAAVSIAAQILTTPIAMYYFHQFPVYFLLSNLVVVPVSTIILVGTLLLVILSPIKIAAAFVGLLLNKLIWWLNSFIESLENFPFALWSGIQINTLQTWLLFIVIAGIGFWMIEKHKQSSLIAMFALLLFFSIRTYSFLEAQAQQKIIVYNANKYTAVDFISGRQLAFAGNPQLFQNTQLANYTVTPSRILNRVKSADNLSGLYQTDKATQFGSKKILFINRPISKDSSGEKLNVDLVILSGNPRLYIADLLKKLQPQQIVIDGSVPAYKANYWTKDCDSFHISCHNIAEKGAFVINF